MLLFIYAEPGASNYQMPSLPSAHISAVCMLCNMAQHFLQEQGHSGEQQAYHGQKHSRRAGLKWLSWLLALVQRVDEESWTCYVLFVLIFVLDVSLLTMLFPISLAAYALLTQRPSALYWQVGAPVSTRSQAQLLLFTLAQNLLVLQSVMFAVLQLQACALTPFDFGPLALTHVDWCCIGLNTLLECCEVLPGVGDSSSIWQHCQCLVNYTSLLTHVQTTPLCLHVGMLGVFGGHSYSTVPLPDPNTSPLPGCVTQH